MEHLEQTIAVYEKLRKGKYRITIEGGTVVEAIYFLYKRRGTPYTADYMVHMLFLGRDAHTGAYFPTTYIAEASNRYISGQKMLDCSIERLLPKSKAPVGA